MDRHEHLDVMKMAITILMTSLVIGAAVTFFYFNIRVENQFDKAMVNATNSSRMNRLKDLQDLSFGDDVSNYPLVTQVMSALDNFSAEELLYIRILSAGGTDGPVMPPDKPQIIIHYKGYVPSDLDGVTGLTPSETPVALAQEHLMHYAQCRCKLEIGTTEQLWSFITITLYNDKEVLK